MSRKNILFYGDSNTHGTKPSFELRSSGRYCENERWVSILQKKIESDWNVIAEGLPSRTTVYNDPIGGEYKNGLTYLRPCLESHFPIDVFAVMLGTNDLKTRFSLTSVDIACGVNRLIEEVKLCCFSQKRKNPKFIILCPPPIVEVEAIADIFSGGETKSKELALLYQKIAKLHDALFFDVGSVVKVSQIDGVHLDVDQHKILAKSLENLIRNIIV